MEIWGKMNLDMSQNKLIGTWKLHSIVSIDELGNEADYFGENPEGVIMYDAAGNMNAQLHQSNRPLFGVEDWSKGSDEEIRRSFVSRKSWSGATSSLQSTTQAGAMKSLAGIESTALFGRSLPETQWMGASKWVPVCSLSDMLCQNHMGPSSLYSDTTSFLNDHAGLKSGGKEITG